MASIFFWPIVIIGSCLVSDQDRDCFRKVLQVDSLGAQTAGYPIHAMGKRDPAILRSLRATKASISREIDVVSLVMLNRFCAREFSTFANLAHPALPASCIPQNQVNVDICRT